MNSSQDFSPASLHDFCDAPVRYADPALVAGLIAPGLRTETAKSVLHAPRTTARANALLTALMPRADVTGLDRHDAALILAGRASLARVALAAGAVWHGKRVRALLRGAEIAALEAACGPDARTCALRHAAPVDVQPAGDLVDDIRHDAGVCIDAWCAALPDWAAARMRLVRRPAAPPDHAATRAALMRSLVPEVLA